MFTPSQLEQIPIKLQQHMTDLEMNIMQDIVRRININSEITRSADWQIYRLQQMGKSSEYIKQQIQQSLKLTDAEIDNLYEGAIQSGYARDKRLYEATGKPFTELKDNEELQQLIQATIKQTKSDMVNICQSLGFTLEMNGKTVFTPIAQYYQQVLDEAVLGITTGTVDYNTMLKKVVNEMTKSGLRTVDYASGWTNRIEVASRRALMSGVTQVTNKVNEMNAEALDTDKFEVSWHGSARPDHQEWQGRVYTKQQLIDVCGLGTVTGLCGANCYHSYYPFIEGISERTYTDKQLEEMNAKENTPKEYRGKEYNTYEASQRQRNLETLMRSQRQKIKLLKGGNVTEDDLINVQAKYRSTMAQYKKFSEEMELPQQKERIYMDGLGKVA
jgi:transcription elongation factor Elf1